MRTSVIASWVTRRLHAQFILALLCSGELVAQERAGNSRSASAILGYRWGPR